MDGNDNSLGTGRTRGGYLLGHTLPIDQRHLDPITGLDAVGTVRIIEESYPHAVDITDKGNLYLSVGDVMICTYMVNAGATAQRYFQIAYGIIGRRNGRSYQRETIGIVISLVSLGGCGALGLIQLCLMLHGVTHKQQISTLRFAGLSRSRQKRQQAEQ